MDNSVEASEMEKDLITENPFNLKELPVKGVVSRETETQEMIDESRDEAKEFSVCQKI